MGTVVASVSLLAALILASAAEAVVPPGGTRFAGTTSAPAVGTFNDPVSFTVSPSARAVSRFTFGSFGCFGAGGFPPNKNPYALPFTTVKLPSIPLTATGSFAATVETTIGPHRPTSAVTKVTISARFSRRAGKIAATGKIVLWQTYKAQKCGPAMMTFSAAPR